MHSWSLGIIHLIFDASQSIIAHLECVHFLPFAILNLVSWFASLGCPSLNNSFVLSTNQTNADHDRCLKCSQLVCQAERCVTNSWFCEQAGLVGSRSIEQPIEQPATNGPATKRHGVCLHRYADDARLFIFMSMEASLLTRWLLSSSHSRSLLTADLHKSCSWDIKAWFADEKQTI